MDGNVGGRVGQRVSGTGASKLDRFSALSPCCTSFHITQQACAVLPPVLRTCSSVGLAMPGAAAAGGSSDSGPGAPGGSSDAGPGGSSGAGAPVSCSSSMPCICSG